MAAHVTDLHVRADEPSVEGHFPGNPIVPGAVLLREIVRVLGSDGGAACCEIRSARFYQPVHPGDRLTIRWDSQASGDIAFTCSRGTTEPSILSGTLRMRVA
jgi:3-hydroxyacyl-[acyl-carrier-protein] dehydratase